MTSAEVPAMSELYFTDRDAPPTDRTITHALGRAAGAWDELLTQLRAEGLRETWKYYGDGKSWLLNVSRGTRTVCWIAVERGAFRVGFYFPERVLGTLLASDLSRERKAEIRAAAPNGKLRRVSIRFGAKGGIRDVMTLVALKRQA
jgi:hypothetical protein